MIITNDGSKVHVMNDAGSWTIENGWLTLSIVEARKMAELLVAAPQRVEEQEPEDG